MLLYVVFLSGPPGVVTCFYTLFFCQVRQESLHAFIRYSFLRSARSRYMLLHVILFSGPPGLITCF